MENISLYHGTDVESAVKIKTTNTLLSSNPKVIGPGVCLTLSKAIEFAVKKNAKEGRIVIIENVPETVLNTATKETKDVFVLNDEFKKPLSRFCFQSVKIITIEEARLIVKQQPKILKEKVYLTKKK